MSKFISLLLVAVLCFAGLVGCANTPAADNNAAAGSQAEPEAVDQAEPEPEPEPDPAAVSSGEKIPIRFMYWNKEESLQSLIALINERLPHIDFQFEFVDIASFQTVYKTQMAAGEGPDLLSIEKISTEAIAGYPLDLTDYDFVTRYSESSNNEMSYNGRIYGIAGPSWFGGYFYNKAMFEENGWTIPKTYDEFLTLCADIQAAGIKPLANPIKNPNYLMHYALSYVQPAFTRSDAGMNFDQDYAAGKVTMAAAFGPYLEKWSQVVTGGYVTAEDLGMDFDQAIDEFCTGKAAMIDSGPWDVETIYGKNPDIKIDMMPYVGDDANNPGWLFGGPGIRFGINAKLGEAGNEEKLQACLEIMDLISTEEGQLAYWENNKGGSSYLTGCTLEMPAEYDGCKEVFAAGQVYASFSQWNSGVFEEFGSQLQGFVAGDVTLEQVMAATDAKNAEALEKLEAAE